MPQKLVLNILFSNLEHFYPRMELISAKLLIKLSGDSDGFQEKLIEYSFSPPYFLHGKLLCSSELLKNDGLNLEIDEFVESVTRLPFPTLKKLPSHTQLAFAQAVTSLACHKKRFPTLDTIISLLQSDKAVHEYTALNLIPSLCELTPSDNILTLSKR